MRLLRFLLLCLAIGVPIQSMHAELIAHYEFDGDALDSSGNNNDGFDEGDATPVDDGLFGGAFSFGTDTPPAGGVIVPLDLGPESYPDLTIAMWVKPDEAIVGAPGLYKTFGHDDGGWDRGFGLDNRQAGGYRYASFNGNGIVNTTGTEITEDWTFLAAVWDTDNEDDPLNSAATVTFYAGANSITEPLRNGNGQLDAVIGAVRPDDFAETWRGLIDEVTIWDEALSEDEINDLRFPDRLDVAGDANDDGVVDLADYELIQANSFQPDPIGDPRLGDVNLDRVVDFEDFRIWKANFGGGAGGESNSVPEPSTSTLLVGVVALGALLRRRRHA